MSSTGSPPPTRLATAQALAYARRRPALHPSLQRVQQRFGKKFRKAEVTFGQGLTDAGHSKKLMEVFTKLLLLPRRDLRPAFRGVSFATISEDARRMDHVLNEFARKGTARYVELAELFPEPRPSGDGDSGSAIATSHCGASVSVVDEDDDDIKSVRVLLIASAGCGKTTLMAKYCPLQWARGELWADKFDFVVAKEFRYEETRHIKGVEDLFGGWKAAGVASCEDQQRIIDFVTDNPQRVCLILDGLDETKLSKCSEYLRKVIGGEELCGMYLVLTSRATEDVFKLAESHPFDRRVELVGFLPSDVPQYVQCVVGGDLAEKLLGELHGNQYLAGVMCTPFFAAAVCDLYRWCNMVPRCLSDIFELIILRVAQRRTNSTYDTWDDLEDDMKELILDLGKFAFRMLVGQRLVFDGSDLKNLSLSEEAVGLGLLVACERDAEATSRQWCFAHLSLQEGLSAMFVAHGTRIYPSKMACLVDALGPLRTHLQTFWQLLSAQLSIECLDSLLRALMLQNRKSSMTGKALECLLFDRDIVPRCVLDVLRGQFTQHSMDRLAEKLLDGLVSGNGARAVENEMPQGRQTSNTDFLRTLVEMWERQCSEANVDLFLGAVQDLDATTKDQCYLVLLSEAGSQAHEHQLSMQECAENDRYQGYNSTLRFRKELVYRCYAEHVQHMKDDGKVKTVPLPCLSELLRLHGLNIPCNMSAMEVYSLEHVIKNHNPDISKAVLCLGDDGLSDIEMDTIQHVLLMLQHATELKLSIRNLTRTDQMCSIVNFLSSQLLHLSLQIVEDDCPMSCSDFATAVASCKKLKRLVCTPLGNMLPPLAAAIASLEELEILSLDLCWIFSFEPIQAFLYKMTGLVSFQLVRARSICMSAIAEALQNWPRLKALHLTAVRHTYDMSAADCDAFFAAIRKCTSLEYLAISSRQRRPSYGEHEALLLARSSYPAHLTVDLSPEQLI